MPWFLCVFSTSLLKTQWEKAEIACNEQFLLFPQCFQTLWKTFLPFSSNLKLLSANSFSFEGSKIRRLGKGFSGVGATIREGPLIRRNTVGVFCHSSEQYTADDNDQTECATYFTLYQTTKF